MPAGTSRANVAATALGCTGGAKPGARTRAHAAWLRDELSRMVADFSSPILADDRSSLWEQLVDSYLARKDLRNARAAAAAWARFLEAEAARAPDARARAVFDSHRLLAYLALGEPARALPMLEQSEREFPDDYNAPARLARALLELGRTDEALAAIDRAKARVYGPRALRVLSQRADVMAARGDRAGELATLREAVQLGRASALAGGYAKLLAALEARLAKLER
jgi:tetratricopeptide (TPR) repeat protein